MPVTQPSAPSRTNDPPSSSSLPPAAIALASKIFDYARDGATESLSQYLSAGIPPNLTNSKGDTLLMLASYHGHPNAVRALLDRGADTDVLNDRGQSIIAGAVFKGHDEIVKLLFDAGADLRLGQPSAVDSARMFRKEAYLNLFGVAGEGRGGQPWEDDGRT